MTYDSLPGTLCGRSEDQSKVTYRNIIGQGEWAWFREHNPITLTNETRGVVALMDGKPAAACAISHYHGYSVQVHQIMLRPIVVRHGWLEVAAAAMFGNHVLVAYGMMPSVNVKAITLSKHLGFVEVGRIPDANGPGDDYHVFVLPRKDCRYLEENRDE